MCLKWKILTLWQISQRSFQYTRTAEYQCYTQLVLESFKLFTINTSVQWSVFFNAIWNQAFNLSYSSWWHSSNQNNLPDLNLFRVCHIDFMHKHTSGLQKVWILWATMILVFKHDPEQSDEHCTLGITPCIKVAFMRVEHGDFNNEMD